MLELFNWIERFVSPYDLALIEVGIVALKLVCTIFIAGAIKRSRYSSSYWED